MTVTSKGQVTLPAEFRRALGIETGSTLTLQVDESGEARLRKSRTIAEFIGSASDAALPDGRPVTQRDIDEAVTAAVTERYDRGKARGEG